MSYWESKGNIGKYRPYIAILHIKMMGLGRNLIQFGWKIKKKLLLCEYLKTGAIVAAILNM